MADSFSERVDAVFRGLDSKLKSFADCPLKDDPFPVSHASESVPTPPMGRRRGHLGKRSVRHSQRTPDYIRNPHRWKKYDLTDDGSIKKDFGDGLTDDQVNRRAALSFIADLRKRKESERHTDVHEDLPHTDATSDQPKIIFRNPKNPGRKCRGSQIEDETQGKAGSRPQLTSDHAMEVSGGCTRDSGIFRMPEYVVGSKRNRTSREVESSGSCSTSCKTKKKMVTLTHLNEDEEES